ncbi:HSP90 family protein [Austwickia chelonae]|uniref:Putative heat shock protein n=1 Tax=Austwickia chelonae NBRC 105200 TaxID=1184607 RepID=K6UMY7_9MICO|nr:HSP90 family protein [Austwickia chelonae]GAB78536.1 putative heat shock protein [Austwickia chelonae NBRC 105200]
MSAPFQVDLRGVVDLLSHHLYSGPRVYLRELIQNAADALTARLLLAPATAASAPPRITITPADVSPDGRFHLDDNGIGLTREDIDRFLVGIGSSSKPGAAASTQETFIGHFGIGLLACFLVSETIELCTRHDDEEPTWRWTAHSSGTYSVTESDLPRLERGTVVSLEARPEHAHLVREDTVRELIHEFAAYLPHEIVLHTATGPEQIVRRHFPWQADVRGRPCGSALSRRAEVTDLCNDLLGFSPLDWIDLTDPETGLRGIAYLLPHPAGQHGSHRVYADSMLVGDRCESLLPPWAVFARAVVDADRLPLTANREGLHEGELLQRTRDRLGSQILSWLTRTAQTDPSRIRAFLDVHELTVKCLATAHDDLLDAVSRWLTFESTLGPVTLPQFAEKCQVLRYAATVDDFRQLAPVESAQGSSLLNGGGTHDGALILRYAQLTGVPTQLVHPTSLLTALDTPSPGEESSYLPLLDLAGRVLDRAGCDMVVRSFSPAAVPALLLSDRGARSSSCRDGAGRSDDGAWTELLGSLRADTDRPQFVLNSRNQSIRSLRGCEDPGLQSSIIEALYAYALVSGHHPLRPYESALVSRALPHLVSLAMAPGEDV